MTQAGWIAKVKDSPAQFDFRVDNAAVPLKPADDLTGFHKSNKNDVPAMALGTELDIAADKAQDLQDLVLHMVCNVS